MPIQSFLVQVDVQADEDDVKQYIEEAIESWIGGNPDLEDPLQSLRSVLVQPVEVQIREK